MRATPQPRFIALEGGEGAGKTTQAHRLLERLRREDIPAILVHEPGTTALGNHLRAFLKSKQTLSPEAELLLFGAGRAQLVNEVISPSLREGITVVTDRFSGSSMAYQGYGRGIGEAPVENVNAFATQGIQPDLNLLLDLPPRDGLGRTRPGQLSLDEDPGAGSARQDTDETRRFEEQPLAFHRRVQQGYLAQVARDPGAWAVIDAAQTPREVEAAIWQAVQSAFGNG